MARPLRVEFAGAAYHGMARAYGDQDGSGVGQVVRRLEQRSAADATLRKKLAQIKGKLSSV